MNYEINSICYLSYDDHILFAEISFYSGLEQKLPWARNNKIG